MYSSSIWRRDRTPVPLLSELFHLFAEIPIAESSRPEYEPRALNLRKMVGQTSLCVALSLPIDDPIRSVHENLKLDRSGLLPSRSSLLSPRIQGTRFRIDWWHFTQLCVSFVYARVEPSMFLAFALSRSSSAALWKSLVNPT